MEWINIAAAIIGLLSLLLAIAIAWRSRQFQRHVIRLHIGLMLRKADIPWKLRRKPKETLIFAAGSKFHFGDNLLLPCPVVLENPSPLAITNVAVEFLYPAKFLVDNSVFVNSDSSQAIHIGSGEGEYRGMSRFVLKTHDQVLVQYEIPLIRPREKLVLGELLAMPKLSSRSFQHDSLEMTSIARLYKRLEQDPQFFGACIARVEVRSANSDPVAKKMIALAFVCDGEDEIKGVFERSLKNIWDNRLKSGLYFDPLGLNWLRKLRKRPVLFNWENGEIRFHLTDSFPDDVETLQKLMMDSQQQNIAFMLPPWGFSGESFPMEEIVGSLVTVESDPISFLRHLFVHDKRQQVKQSNEESTNSATSSMPPPPYRTQRKKRRKA